jgi:hypothetical protein
VNYYDLTQYVFQHQGGANPLPNDGSLGCRAYHYFFNELFEGKVISELEFMLRFEMMMDFLSEFKLKLLVPL